MVLCALYWQNVAFPLLVIWRLASVRTQCCVYKRVLITGQSSTIRDPSSQEAEAEESQVQSQPEQLSKVPYQNKGLGLRGRTLAKNIQILG